MRRRGGLIGCRAAVCVVAAGMAVLGADGPRPQGVGVRRALIVCGLPGDDGRRKLYDGAVEKIRAALTGRCGFATSEVLVRTAGEASGASSSREGIASAVAELKARLKPEDTLWVIVLGHAHYDGRHSHLNIPGPDMDEREFARLFDGLAAREQVFWVTTSASGFFLRPLAGPGRIVIAATEPDREVNETLFPMALADALSAPPEGIDRDGDGQISVLELYLAAVADVMKRYVDAGTLPTEHARLDDNGDGRGREIQQDYLPPELGGRDAPKSSTVPSKAPEIKPGDDGARAARMRVAPAPGRPSKPGP